MERHIRVVDNFLSAEQHSAILRLFTDGSNPLPWYWMDSTSGEEGGETSVAYEYGFYHLAFHDGEVLSNSFQTIVPALDKAEVETLYRVRFGMQTNIGSSGHHGTHTDMQVPHTTLLYYIGESDGDTVFFDDNGEVVFTNPHTTNQAVIFDGSILHASSPPMNYARRLTMNVNYQQQEKQWQSETVQPSGS